MSSTELLFRNRIEKAPVGFSEARKAYIARPRAKSKVPSPSTNSTIATESQLTASQLLRLMPIAKKSNVKTSIARPPPSKHQCVASQHREVAQVKDVIADVFEHHKLTPHELKTLIELEDWIPRKLLKLDTSLDATSWSNIFVIAMKLIQEGAEKQEKVVEHVKERNRRDDRITELEEKLRRFEESEDTTMAQGGMTEALPAG
jgi:hypothetical protein